MLYVSYRTRLKATLRDESHGSAHDVFVQELTSCGTWMKANVYSVACAGSVRVLKAGGRAARRVEDNISLWKDKRKRDRHIVVL